MHATKQPLELYIKSSLSSLFTSYMYIHLVQVVKCTTQPLYDCFKHARTRVITLLPLYVLLALGG